MNEIRVLFSEYNYLGKKPEELLDKLKAIMGALDIDRTKQLCGMLGSLEWPGSRVWSSDKNYVPPGLEEKREAFKESVLKVIDELLVILDEQ